MAKNAKKLGKLLGLWDNFLVISILNSKYIPCVPNATLTNDGNLPGITLYVRKMLEMLEKCCKNVRKVAWFSAKAKFLCKIM